MKKLFKIMLFISLAFIVLLAMVIVVSAINSPSNSVGIIGGADGPTAIYITQTLMFDSPMFWMLCVAVALSVISVIGFVITKNKK